MIHLDTSILVRFFTNDDKAKARKVKKLLESNNELHIADVVFPELEYVLTRVYKAPRNQIIDAFTFLISCSNIVVDSHVFSAIALYKITNLDMADCLIGVQSYNQKLASFDDKLLKAKGIVGYW